MTDQRLRAMALLEAGHLPDDVRGWLLDFLREPAVVQAAARFQRNGAVRAVYMLATGSALDRGERVIEWFDAHRAGGDVPEAVGRYLESAGESEAPTSWRHVVRIATGR